jgi:hypothetical protein
MRILKTMQPRTPEKNALIIFIPSSVNEAQSFVRESLQYRELYQNFYMLPVPEKGVGDYAPTAQDIQNILNLTKLTRTNTDCFLIRKKAACDWEEVEGDECYRPEVLNIARSFRKHCVAITYNYFLGEKKYSSLTRFRAHQRYKTSQGFPKGAIAQIALLGSNPATKTGVLGWNFFKIKDKYLQPPLHYLQLEGMPKIIPEPHQFTVVEKLNYEIAIEREMTLRQHKIDPIVRSAEQDYNDPQNVAEKLANLFHAYAYRGLTAIARPHRDLAINIATTLYANPAWELEECLNVIKSKTDNYRKPIHAKDRFQGLLREILNMMHNQSIFLVGEQLKATWQEKYNELTKIATQTSKSDKELHACLSSILTELKVLEKNGKPYFLLLKTAEAALEMNKNPTRLNYQKQYQNAREIGQHSGGRRLSGLLLCLLGITLGISIGLVIGLTNGAAAFVAAPLVIKGLVLSASLVKTGTAIASGTLAASLPLIGSAMCLFPKPPIQKQLEKLANIEYKRGKHEQIKR